MGGQPGRTGHDAKLDNRYTNSRLGDRALQWVMPGRRVAEEGQPEAGAAHVGVRTEPLPRVRTGVRLHFWVSSPEFETGIMTKLSSS